VKELIQKRFYSTITIRYDTVYLTSSKNLTGSQLSLPHETNKTLKCETKNKMMSEAYANSNVSDSTILNVHHKTDR